MKKNKKRMNNNLYSKILFKTLVGKGKYKNRIMVGTFIPNNIKLPSGPKTIKFNGDCGNKPIRRK
jgi:hypothetical protein